jgi:hypothetical protein
MTSAGFGVPMHLLFKACGAGLTALVLSVLGACGGGGGGDGASQTDTTAPTITASVTVGTEAVVLSATVSDNVAVTQVDFVVDGGATRATVSDSQGRSVFSTSFPISSFSAGSHSLLAQARDASGNATDAPAVSFNVGQGQGPASPIKVTVSGVVDGANVTFTVDIESDEQIDLTNFFIDGEFLGGIVGGDPNQRQYVFSRVLSRGTHRMVVDVTDVKGNNAQGQVVVEVL